MDIDKLLKISSALDCSITDLMEREYYEQLNGKEKAAVLNSEWIRASASIDRAKYISIIAGYEYVILPDHNEIEEKTIYLSDRKNGTLYAVESDLFTDAINGSKDFIKFKFEKLMKSAKVVDNGK